MFIISYALYTFFAMIMRKFADRFLKPRQTTKICFIFENINQSIKVKGTIEFVN